jgi:uncharacterized protein (DUF58 family)
MNWFRRIQRRRLRLAGQIFVIVALIVLLAAWNSGTNLFYLVFAAVTSFIVLSLFASMYAFRGIKVMREAPYASHRGAPFSVSVRIENRRAVLPLVSVRLEHADAPDTPLGYIVSIPARRGAVLRFTQTFERRGVHRLPDLQLVTTFPFGLIETRRSFHDEVEVVVYPRVLAARTAMVDRVRGAGEIPKLVQGEGDEFHSLREYVPGDDLRYIAWRVSARTDTLMVKELEQQTSKFVVFVLDTRLRPEIEDFIDHFERAIELVASLATTLIHRNYVVAVTTPNSFLPEGEGESHALKLLDMLARLEPTASVDQVRPNWETVSEMGRVTYLHVSPDPGEWGQRRFGDAARVLDPREVIHV